MFDFIRKHTRLTMILLFVLIVPSFVLFGGIGAWALVSMALINRAGPWVPPAAKPAPKVASDRSAKAGDKATADQKPARPRKASATE